MRRLPVRRALRAMTARITNTFKIDVLGIAEFKPRLIGVGPDEIKGFKRGIGFCKPAIATKLGRGL